MLALACALCFVATLAFVAFVLWLRSEHGAFVLGQDNRTEIKILAAKLNDATALLATARQSLGRCITAEALKPIDDLQARVRSLEVGRMALKGRSLLPDGVNVERIP